MMKRSVSQAISLCLMAGLFSGIQQFSAISAAAAETESLEESVVGELIFAQCEEYINVREEASIDSEIVAKIYNNGSATVLSVDGEWYEITSGNAHGYVKAEYFATGEEAEAIAEEVAYNVATVHVDYLNIRTEASTDSGLVDVAKENDQIEVVLYGEDWMKVALGNDVYGYIKADYVTYNTYYSVAETIEEEEARLAAEAEASETAAVQTETVVQTEASLPEAATQTEAAQAEPTAQAEVSQAAPAVPAEVTQAETAAQTEAAQAETTVQTEAAQAETTAQTEAADETESTAETEAASSSSSSLGESIAAYALQFVGNPYVYGGSSLTNGADCSGFVQSVFAHFGISLSRTSAAQATNGTTVSLSEIQAGDLLFYSSSGDGTINHVAIYTGSGMIVHAANSTRGICTDSAYYSTPVCAVRCY